MESETAADTSFERANPGKDIEIVRNGQPENCWQEIKVAGKLPERRSYQASTQLGDWY